MYFSSMVFTGMLDHIIVETGGVKMPLNHLAVVSVLDSKTLSINPYDPNVLTVSSWRIPFQYESLSTLIRIIVVLYVEARKIMHVSSFFHVYLEKY